MRATGSLLAAAPVTIARRKKRKAFSYPVLRMIRMYITIRSLCSVYLIMTLATSDEAVCRML
jgi:hypothetical protein